MLNLSSLGERLLNLLYPPRCIGCGAPDHWLCPTCLAQCFPIEAPRTVRVQNAAEDWELPVFSFAVHQGVAREAVHGLKYEGKRVLAGTMAGQMRASLPEPLSRVDLVLAVPLHERRRRERGYNQSQLLAQSIARDWGLAAPPGCLTRVRETRPQVGLTASERIDNVRGAFAAGDQVRGKTVLLVDDVCTTGATMAACAAAVVAVGGRATAGVTFTRARAGADS